MLPWLQRRWRTGQLRSKDGGEHLFSYVFVQALYVVDAVLPLPLLLNCPVRQRLWSHGNMALYKFCLDLNNVSVSQL